MAKCTTCCTEYATQESFRDHCKELWHTYNLKRKVAGLGPITKEFFEEKTKVAEAKGKGKGKGKAKVKDEPSQQRHRAPMPEPETPWTPNRCLFDQHDSASLEENVAFMQSKYSFFIPDREYLCKPVELLTMLHEKIYEDSTCIFCNKIFATPRDVLKHMQDLGHTRIGTSTTILCGELEPFYDFSNSKSELVTKLKPRARGSEAKEKDADASTSPTESDQEAEQEANERDAEGGEWQDCSDEDCSDDDALEVVECEDEDEFAAVLAEYGLQRTELLPTGDLRLPNGAVATHRRYAYVYKQRFRPHAQDRVQKRLALSLQGTPLAKALTGSTSVGGGAGRGLHGVQAVACGTRMVKTHQRQVVAILKEKQSKEMRLGIHHNNSNMKKFQSKVKVNLYSWAK